MIKKRKLIKMIKKIFIFNAYFSNSLIFCKCEISLDNQKTVSEKNE